MLQIPKNNHLKNTASYHDFAAAYLKQGNNSGVVTIARQHETLMWLNADAVNGQFYFIVDVLSNTVLHCYGIDRWLGHTCQHFTTKKYHEILCPAHAVAQYYYGAAAWQALINNHLPPMQFMQPVCAALLALKKTDGSHVYCRRLCSPFQLTADGRVTQYLCRFTVLGPFDNEPCGTWLYSPDNHLQQAEKMMYGTMQKQFAGDGFFSPQEMRLLKEYAHTAGTTSTITAELFGIKKGTINIYNKRIIEKAEKLFVRRFAHAKEVAGYVKRMGLV